MASVLSELGYTHFATLARSLGSELATVSNDLPLVRGGRLQDINIFRESSAHPRSLSHPKEREETAEETDKTRSPSPLSSSLSLDLRPSQKSTTWEASLHTY